MCLWFKYLHGKREKLLIILSNFWWESILMPRKPFIYKPQNMPTGNQWA